LWTNCFLYFPPYVIITGEDVFEIMLAWGEYWVLVRRDGELVPLLGYVHI